MSFAQRCTRRGRRRCAAAALLVPMSVNAACALGAGAASARRARLRALRPPRRAFSLASTRPAAALICRHPDAWLHHLVPFLAARSHLTQSLSCLPMQLQLHFAFCRHR